MVRMLLGTARFAGPHTQRVAVQQFVVLQVTRPNVEHKTFQDTSSSK
jgi:hypothetical protein